MPEVWCRTRNNFPLPLRMPPGRGCLEKVFGFHLCVPQSSLALEIIPTIIWTIWCSRNSIIFYNVKAPIVVLVAGANSLWESIHNAFWRPSEIRMLSLFLAFRGWPLGKARLVMRYPFLTWMELCFLQSRESRLWGSSTKS